MSFIEQDVLLDHLVNDDDVIKYFIRCLPLIQCDLQRVLIRLIFVVVGADVGGSWSEDLTSKPVTGDWTGHLERRK